MLRGTMREVLAEFLGTFVLILFGAGVVAQYIVSKQVNGSYLAINISWGLGVVMGCYVSAGVSGGHLNPAVTLAAAVHRGFPWRKVLPYVAGQFAGAFVAAAVVYVTYREGLAAFDGGVRQVLGPQGTAGIFATYPQPYLSTFPGGFIDQVVGTAILVGGLFAAAILSQSTATAQHVVEIRAADTKYRYVDWNFTFENAAVVDVFYVGVPDSNELNAGGGYAFKRGRFVLTPLLYVVLGKEGSQRGVKIALLASFERDGWKLLSFVAHYAPVKGSVGSYQDGSGMPSGK